ncbi:DegT/DnrJ/EryC1/StrS family aminotransferase [Patescibacteria group bacterium]|nr:DegT/DnrJ/EryC1/StrS family aminotransferase [Patescibacteria group bacterium]
MKIPLSKPDLTNKEINAVVSVLKTPNLSLGPKVTEFEDKFAKYIGTKHAVSVSSGTAGLHLCIKSLEIGAGHKVITTPFSFIASSNCILFEGAKPVFVDIREDTLNIDEQAIEQKITKRTKAILPVHVFGYPCEMDKIYRVARKHNLAVIEDACEAIGAEYKNRKVGALGDCAVFAFYPNKQMTTGEGGMVSTNNRKIFDLCCSLKNQGRDKGMKWLLHRRLGYNYRLSDINCALGIVQLERINELLAKRDRIAGIYNKKLANIEEIILPPRTNSVIKRSYFVYVIRLTDAFTKRKRDSIIDFLKKNGIRCNSYFPAIHLQPFYVKKFGFKRGDFPVTEKIADRTIALPFFNNLNEKQIVYIVERLKRAIKGNR